MQLKEYQQRSLDALSGYFRGAVQHDAETAFVLATKRPDRAVPGLAGMPYICLRVPTGGGKTLMASHAVQIAARDYMQADRVVCLWLVPSNVIREQTLAALQNRQHPYRQALDTAFGGNVVVTDLADALQMSAATPNGATVVLVSTLAALRVEETEGRKVYESNGAMQPHFVGLDETLRDKLEKEGDGRVIYSLANVLRLRRPVVVMDEAHNARTSLSFDTLTRFAPSCVIEFTATPETNHSPAQGVYASNVLHHVSASELKEAEMIKLPIKFWTKPDWKEVLSEAIAKRNELEKLAIENEKATGEYLRPLLLIAAQPQNRNKPTLTVDVVKEALMKDHKIPEDQIAIATGQTRGLEDVNLFDRIPLRIIITVQALREGWDCSFAYVLCALAEQNSPRSVEQILGRVLRMPRAQKKNDPSLNVAYAYAVEQGFVKTAKTLQDALIQNGFQALEARDFAVAQQAPQGLFDDPALFGATEETISEAPDLSELPPDLDRRVTYDETTKTLAVVGPMSESDRAALEKCVSTRADKKAVEQLYIRSRGRRAATEAETVREPFRVPWLSVRVGDQLELFDDSHFLQAEWKLAECDHVLSEASFPSTWSGGKTGEIDVSQAGRVELKHFTNELHEQMALVTGEPGWDTPALVNWLDRKIRHPDVPQVQSSLFIYRAVTDLMESRKATVAQLARLKYRLRNAIEEKISQLRGAHRRDAYQAYLFGPQTALVEVDPVSCFEFDADRYAPNWYYDGHYRFRRHYVRPIGELKGEGEEYECAVRLDQMDEVDCWIRNLAGRSETSFWLPTSTDRFYPDFVAKLRDGRILVVEYKGENLWSNDDSKEKFALGKLWAQRSGGQCLFVMPKGPDWPAITACLGESHNEG